MPQQMTLEDYKRKVQACLEATMSRDTAVQLMKGYEEELQECYNGNWTPAAVAAGVASGLL